MDEKYINDLLARLQQNGISIGNRDKFIASITNDNFNEAIEKVVDLQETANRSVNYVEYANGISADLKEFENILKSDSYYSKVDESSQKRQQLEEKVSNLRARFSSVSDYLEAEEELEKARTEVQTIHSEIEKLEANATMSDQEKNEKLFRLGLQKAAALENLKKLNSKTEALSINAEDSLEGTLRILNYVEYSENGRTWPADARYYSNKNVKAERLDNFRNKLYDDILELRDFIEQLPLDEESKNKLNELVVKMDKQAHATWGMDVPLAVYANNEEIEKKKVQSKELAEKFGLSINSVELSRNIENTEEVKEEKVEEEKAPVEEPKVKDVSQSTNIYEIAEVIQQLNPNAEIRVGNMSLDSMAEERFFSSVPVEQLVLPEGFYYNEKNGITNKHNTQSGMYCSLKVEDLSKADESILLPKEPVEEPEKENEELPEEPKIKPIENKPITTYMELEKVLKELNEGKSIELKSDLLEDGSRNYYLEIAEPEKLVYPEGFEFTGNTISNAKDLTAPLRLDVPVKVKELAKEQTHEEEQPERTSRVPKKGKVTDIKKAYIKPYGKAILAGAGIAAITTGAVIALTPLYMSLVPAVAIGAGLSAAIQAVHRACVKGTEYEKEDSLYNGTDSPEETVWLVHLLGKAKDALRKKRQERLAREREEEPNLDTPEEEMEQEEPSMGGR